MWPFTRTPEHRASYTEAAIQHIIREAAGGTLAADVNATSAAQAAAGLIGRSLAIATVEPEGVAAALNAATLYDIGCALTLDGEAVYLIEVDAGAIVLRRASDWDVRDAGERWRYKLTLPGATDTRQVDVAGDQTFHPRINVSRQEPARGRGMIALAGLTANILASVERCTRRRNRRTERPCPAYSGGGPESRGPGATQDGPADLEGQDCLGSVHVASVGRRQKRRARKTGKQTA